MKRCLCFLIMTLCMVSDPRSWSFAASIEPALIDTFGHEGGLQCDKSDPGNWTGGKIGAGRSGCTKFGIATNTYPNEDIRNLDLARAGQLYRRDFWNVMRGDRIDSQILAGELFDWGVNQGIRTAIKRTQEACNLAYYPAPPQPVDGSMGPATLACLNGKRQDAVYVNMIGLRYGRYYEIARKNPRMMPYFRSWTMRIKDNVRDAVHDYDEWLQHISETGARP